LIDTFQRLRRDMTSRDAILRAAAQRLRPILITTVTTMIGLLPMALHVTVNVVSRSVEFGAPEGFWWVQFATAIIFGLGFSTLLTLILVPVMITLPEKFADLRHWGRERFSAFRGA
jgi:multidrug efflux pump